MIISQVSYRTNGPLVVHVFIQGFNEFLSRCLIRSRSEIKAKKEKDINFIKLC